MKQLELILKTFHEYEFKEGLDVLFYLCGNFLKEIDPKVKLEYGQDVSFFKVLKILLESGDISLFYNLNSADPSRDGELLLGSPKEQIEQLQQVWIGSFAIHQMDQKNNYLGWYFLIHCPYALAHKLYDEDGKFVRWLYTD